MKIEEGVIQLTGLHGTDIGGSGIYLASAISDLQASAQMVACSGSVPGHLPTM